MNLKLFYIVIPERGAIQGMRFDSMADMALAADAVCGPWHRDKVNGDAWHGWCDWEKAMLHATIGTVDAGADVAKLLERMPSMPETMGKRWSNSIAGHHPNVARFVAGHPDSMRSRRPLADEHNPLSIIVDPASSQGVNADKLKARGAAILAVATALSAVRPVKLSIACGITAEGEDSEGTFGETTIAVAFDVGSSPLDMSLAAAALQSQGVTRGLLYNLIRVASGRPEAGTLTWPFGVKPADARQASEHAKLMRAYSGISDDEPALIVPAAYLEHPSVNKPEQWVADMLALYAPGGALEAA